jgi:hypothetical protein
MTVSELYDELTPLIMRIGPRNGSVVPVQVLISNRSYALESIELDNKFLNLNHGKHTMKFNQFSKKILNIIQELRNNNLSDNIEVVSGPLHKEITKVNYTNNVVQLIV